MSCIHHRLRKRSLDVRKIQTLRASSNRGLGEVLLQRNLQPLGSGSTEDWLFLILEAALVLFVLRYVLEEATEFVGVESKNNRIAVTIKWDYFLDAWNVLDWFNLIMMIITVCYKVDTWSKAGGLYVISPSDWQNVGKDMYSNFHSVAANVRQIQSLVAFNTILTWFKALTGEVEVFKVMSFPFGFLLGVPPPKKQRTSLGICWLVFSPPKKNTQRTTIPRGKTVLQISKQDTPKKQKVPKNIPRAEKKTKNVRR